MHFFFQSCSTLVAIFFHPEEPHHFPLCSCKLTAML